MADPLMAVQDLRALLDIEEIDTDLFRGNTVAERPGRVFGGQVVAQALSAAARSVGEGTSGERQAHSLHAYFLRAGDTTHPIIYRVLRDFDGASFSNRRVVAMQRGRPILNMAASFHRREEGLAHAAPLPSVVPPEHSPTFAEALAAKGLRQSGAMGERLAAFEIRPGPPSPDGGGRGVPEQYFWFRLAAPLDGDAVLQRVMLAYASDFALLMTALLPHRITFSPDLQAASLDHALWFHSEPQVDDWLLYTMDSPWTGNARGFARGMIFNRAGTLVASAAQEGQLRIRKTKG